MFGSKWHPVVKMAKHTQSNHNKDKTSYKHFNLLKMTTISRSCVKDLLLIDGDVLQDKYCGLTCTVKQTTVALPAVQFTGISGVLWQLFQFGQEARKQMCKLLGGS